MNRLFEIAKELGEIANKRLQGKQLLDESDQLLKGIMLRLIPEGGWPGKNADERKAAELKAYDDCVILQEEQERRASIKETFDLLEADREALIAERDAWQWTIRDNEVAASVGYGRSVFAMMETYQTEKEWAEYNAQEAADQARAQAQQDAYDELNQIKTEGLDPDEPPF